ncbi:MAG: AAA family ATPase [Patescibacteria group bacterium]
MAPQAPSVDLNRVENAINSLKDELDRLSKGEKVAPARLAALKRNVEYIERLLARHKTLLESARNSITALKDVKARYDELSEMFEKLLAEYNALKEPPNIYVHFVRFLGEIDVVINDSGKTKKFPLIEVTDYHGIYRRVLVVNEKIKVGDFKRGERLVALSNGNVIDCTQEFETVGEEAIVEQVLGEDREGTNVLVRVGANEAVRTAHIASSFTEELCPGKRVLIDASAGFVLSSLPDKESKKYLVPQMPKETFADIGGLDAVTEQIRQDILWPIIYPEIYARFGKPSFKGYVLSGPPGCGKTLISRALISELAKLLSSRHGVKIEGNFFYVGGTELLNKWVGNTEEWMRDIFSAAERASLKTSPPSPVGIIFDDAENMFKVRGSGISSDVNESHVTQICTLLQGLKERGNVFVLFLTNRPEMMDPAVTRHGRVSDSVFIPRPNKSGAKAIFLKYLKPDWKILHPKYNVDLYQPTRDGKPILDDIGAIKRIQFACDSERVVEYLVDSVLERLFGDKNEFRNELLRVLYVGDKKPTVLRYGDFVSGALIAEGIMPKVLQMAINEAVEQEKKGLPINTGVQSKFFYDAVESVFEKIRAIIITRSPRELANWLAVEGHAPKPIKGFLPPSDTVVSGKESKLSGGAGDEAGSDDDLDEEER